MAKFLWKKLKKVLISFLTVPIALIFNLRPDSNQKFASGQTSKLQLICDMAKSFNQFFKVLFFTVNHSNHSTLKLLRIFNFARPVQTLKRQLDRLQNYN